MQFLFYGAPIYTLWDSRPRAEALVVENGIIAAVGEKNELIAQFPGAKKVGLEGGAVIPAFNDSHAHILSAGLALTRADLRGCQSFAEIQSRLQDWIAGENQKGWVYGIGYDQNLLPESKHITRYDLDRISRERPVAVRHTSGHCTVVNSRALELAGVTHQTPDPSDGRIERDESGEPTGVLLERAWLLVERHIPPLSVDEIGQAVRRICEVMVRRGILSASDATTGRYSGIENEWRGYARALEQGARVRMTLMPDYDQVVKAGWLNRRQDVVVPQPHPDLRLGAVKLYIDGALGPRTAALKEPYADGSNSTVLIYPPEEFSRRVETAHRGGWQIGVHAIGDLAVDLTVQAYEKAQTAFPRPDPRHRVEHCFLTDAGVVRKMVRFGIIAAVQPEFLYHLSHFYRSALGDRADRGMPIRTWLQAGVTVAFSSDQPVVPGDPIIGWRAAVDRKHKTGFTVAPGEGLDPLTALRCFTVGSAHAIFDDTVGILAPGKRADFAVLSHSPEKIAEEDVKVLTSSAFLP
ncbi:MAG: amidohydrolase [Syntrophaceae bacterium]|nr:amidohydrolase [Syntrophaceae bacterium]